jgi:hypothetical protein
VPGLLIFPGTLRTAPDGTLTLTGLPRESLSAAGGESTVLPAVTERVLLVAP